MPGLWYNDGGTWRSAKALWYNDAGTWRKTKALWYNDAGTWRLVFTGFAPTNATISSAFTVAGSTAAPQVVFDNDGSTQVKNSSAVLVAGPDWGDPITVGIGSSVWVEVVLGSGSATVTGTVGSVVSLSAGQAWSIPAPSPGNVSERFLTYTLYSDAGGVTAIGTGTIHLLSDRS